MSDLNFWYHPDNQPRRAGYNNPHLPPLTRSRWGVSFWVATILCAAAIGLLAIGVFL